MIVTQRLRLASFSDVHMTDQYVGWLNDPEATRFSSKRHSVHTIESCRAFRDAQARCGNYFWAIERTDCTPYRHIGNMVAYLDRNNSTANLSILIGEKDCWHGGYGSEAWNAACRWLLTEGEIRKVWAGTMALNTPMLGLMRKAGMVEDGVRRREMLWKGQEVDVIYAALFNDMVEMIP